MNTHPTGTVTLVFTDIQDSTKLWDKLRESFDKILEDHNTLIRDIMEKHHGYEVKTEGDAFMIAFSQANDALTFCLEAQERLHQHKWPDSTGEILVRMGLHSGNSIVKKSEHGRYDYFGPMVNCAARISSCGHGGQILLSKSTYELTSNAFNNTAITHLGEHRFKGIEQAQTLYQILPQSLAYRSFPPVKTIDIKRTNLSKHPSSFLGRANEILQLNKHFHKNKSRLVTITGPGGTGKTRLSQCWASLSLGDFEAGVWLADITEAQSKDAIFRCLALTFNITLNTDDPLTQLGNCLDGMCRASNGSILILLDNCEQVLQDLADILATWLKMAPQAKFLLTSRTLLNLEGENELALDQLGIPTLEEIENKHKLESFSSIQLFILRSQECNTRFKANDSNIQDIARICHKLDGIPLALELAASRSKILSPKKLLDKLNKQFDILKNQRRGIHDRQATLKGTIDWGWNLLLDFEKSTLAQISTFKGEFLLEAAEQVVDLDSFDDAPMAMDIIQSLKDKSFLKVRESEELEGEPLFSTYQTIKSYASEKLEEIGLTEVTKKRWQEWIFSYAKQWWEEHEKSGHTESLQRLRQIFDGLLDLAQSEEVEKHISAWATIFVYPILKQKGPADVVKPMIEKALKNFTVDVEALKKGVGVKINDDASGELVSQLILVLADDYLKSDPSLTEVLAQHISEENFVFSKALQLRGASQYFRGEYDKALQYHNQALTIYQKLGNQVGEAANLANIGIVHRSYGENNKALQYYNQALTIDQKLGNQAGEAANLTNIGIVHRSRGEYGKALQHYNQALTINQKLGRQDREVLNLVNIGNSYCDRDEYDNALQHYNQALTINQKLGRQLGEAINLGNIGQTFTKLLLENKSNETKEISLQSAYEHLTKSIQINKNLGHPRQFSVEVDLARCAHAMGHQDEAQSLAKSAQLLAEEQKISEKDSTYDRESLRQLKNLLDLCELPSSSIPPSE